MEFPQTVLFREVCLLQPSIKDLTSVFSFCVVNGQLLLNGLPLLSILVFLFRAILGSILSKIQSENSTGTMEYLLEGLLPPLSHLSDTLLRSLRANP